MNRSVDVAWQEQCHVNNAEFATIYDHKTCIGS